MKQFIYLDTDIVSSKIAQSEKGVVTQQTIESGKPEELGMKGTIYNANH